MDQIDGEIKDNKKCYACGQSFKTSQHLQNHKNRLTPCLIREVPPDQVNNPNRCIFCNKIFSTRSNLNKHLTICKIKNGGMEMLVDKVKYDQEIRILKEQNKKLEDRLEEQNKRLEEQNKRLDLIQQTPAQTINNTTINAPITININNYLRPNLQHLAGGKLDESTFFKLYQENKVQTPVAMIPHIWFNPDVPENFSIYLVNKLTGETMVYNGSDWEVKNGNIVVRELRDRAYQLAAGLYRGAVTQTQLLKSPNDEFIFENMAKNQHDKEVAKIETEKVYFQIIAGRRIVRPFIPKNM